MAVKLDTGVTTMGKRWLFGSNTAHKRCGAYRRMAVGVSVRVLIRSNTRRALPSAVRMQLWLLYPTACLNDMNVSDRSSGKGGGRHSAGQSASRLDCGLSHGGD